MFLLFTLLGAVGGLGLGLVPALPVYVVLGWLLQQPGWLTPEQAAFGSLGLLVGHALSSGLLAVYQIAPHEGTVLVQQFARRYVQMGLGPQVVAWYGWGSLGGLGLLVLLAPLALWVLPTLHSLTQPHGLWLVGSLAVLFVLSAPLEAQAENNRWHWAIGQTAVGWLTFGLAGFLGWRLLYPNPLINDALPALWPLSVGLFTLPTVLGQGWARPQIAAPVMDDGLNITPQALAQGLFWGCLSGGVAAFLPGLSAGVGSWLVAQQLSPRQTPALIVAHGCNQVWATVGAYWLLFIPGLVLSRGNVSGLVQPIYSAFTPQVFYQSVGALALVGGGTWLLLGRLAPIYARAVAGVTQRFPWAGWLAIVLVLGLMGVSLGWAGMAVLGVATAIGLLPVLWGAPRLSAVGVFVLPLVLQALGMIAR